MSEIDTETEVIVEWPTDPVGRALFSVGYGFSLVGGVLMMAVALMVVASIVGRALFSAPVYGDFELVAMGTAISVFLFLPYCHLTRKNVIVDLFLAHAPERVKHTCDVVASLLFCVFAFVLAWRSWVGGISMFDVKETTMILSIPLWIAFPFIVISMAVLGVCCLYTAAIDFSRLTK